MKKAIITYLSILDVMKLKLMVFVLTVLAIQGMAQKKIRFVKAKNMVGTEWTAVKIWRIPYDNMDKEEEIPMEEFGGWDAVVGINFIDKKKFEGTKIDGTKKECHFQLSRDMFSYHYDTEDYLAYVDGKFVLLNDSQFTLSADFCRDGCYYKLLFQKK